MFAVPTCGRHNPTYICIRTKALWYLERPIVRKVMHAFVYQPYPVKQWVLGRGSLNTCFLSVGNERMDPYNRPSTCLPKSVMLPIAFSILARSP